MRTYKIHCKLILNKALGLRYGIKNNILNIESVYKYYLHNGFIRFK